MLTHVASPTYKHRLRQGMRVRETAMHWLNRMKTILTSPYCMAFHDWTLCCYVQILTPGVKIVLPDMAARPAGVSPTRERLITATAKSGAQANETEILPLLLAFITSNPPVKAAAKLVQVNAPLCEDPCQ
jgi:phage tail protein X